MQFLAAGERIVNPDHTSMTTRRLVVHFHFHGNLLGLNPNYKGTRYIVGIEVQQGGLWFA